jgi:type I restriction enzyme, S subunit
MSVFGLKNAVVVRSSWLGIAGRRLDCNPYMANALEARDALERLQVSKEKLGDVTDRIFHAGREGRVWVEDLEYGVPFLGSSDILLSDLSVLPLMSKKQIERNPLFTLKEGWTLITRSGTVGRMAYARPKMNGMACSEHVLRVVPSCGRIPPGYLYAFLSSRYGVPLVAAGTYGAIIQHIEPEHVANLPVPRFEDAFETRVHDLIESAAVERSSAQLQLEETVAKLEEEAGFTSVHLSQVTAFSTSATTCSELNDRLDAPYHSATALTAETLLNQSTFDARPIAEVAKRYFKPPIFKRLWVDSAEYGNLFVSGNDIYRYGPEEPRYVSRRTPKYDEFILQRGWVAFQAAGQIYGLFGRPLYVSGWLEGTFCADDVFRIVPHNEVDGAFLYLFLKTSVGEALIKRQACGNSIPRVWEPHISQLRVIWPNPDVREKYARAVIEAHEAIERGRQSEMKAIAILEQRIHEGQ